MVIAGIELELPTEILDPEVVNGTPFTIDCCKSRSTVCVKFPSNAFEAGGAFPGALNFAVAGEIRTGNHVK